MCVSVFTGCNLIETNQKGYYDAVVATISYVDGEKEEITRRELITAYYSYGTNYVDNYGYTQEQAIIETLDSIVERKLTVKDVENYCGGEDKVFNSREKSYVYDQTFDALYSNFKDYYNDIVGFSEGTASEASASVSVYKKYTSSVTLTADYIIKNNTPATTIASTYTDKGVDYEFVNSENKQIYKQQMMNDLLAGLESQNGDSAKDWRSAFNAYLSDIKDNYGYMEFEKDEEWFAFEMDRVYNIIKENYIVEKYTAIHNQQAHQDADISNVTVDAILKSYSAKVRADYSKYAYATDNSAYETAMLGDIANVDYILQGENVGDYFYIAPIKISLSQTQQDDLARWEEQLSAGTLDPIEYDELVSNLYSGDEINATIRSATTGEVEGSISATELLEEIKFVIDGIEYEDMETSSDKNATYEYNKMQEIRRAEAFRKYLYLYNDDDSLKGSEFNTVFGVKNGEVLANDTFSANEDVKGAILDLYKNGNAQVGDMTGLVKADDALYIFFYAGKVENLFASVDKNFDISKQVSNIDVLTKTRLNIFSEKTLFDKIYEEVVSDRFATFENLNMDNLKSSLVKKDGIKYIENNLKALYN